MPNPHPELKDFVEFLTDEFDLKVLFAVPVYGLTLDQLQGNPNPEQVGWRAVAVDEGRSLVASEIPKDWKDKPVVRFTRGTIVEQSLEAFRLLRHDPKTRDAHLRQLRVSALRLDTFWVQKTDTGGEANKIAAKDVILPFTRFPLENALRELDGDSFLRHAQEAAERRKPGNDREIPQPPPDDRGKK